MGCAVKDAYLELMHSASGSSMGRINTFNLFSNRLIQPLKDALGQVEEVDLQNFFKGKFRKWQAYFRHSRKPDLELDIETLSQGKFKIQRIALDFIVDYATWFFLQKHYLNITNKNIKLKAWIKNDSKKALRIELTCPELKEIERINADDDSGKSSPEALLFPNQVYQETNVQSLTELLGGNMDVVCNEADGLKICITIPEAD